MFLDARIFLWFNGLTGNSRLFDLTTIFLAEYLPYLMAVVLVAILAARPGKADRNWWLMAGVPFVSAFLARFGVTEIIRFFYHRPRPFIVYQIAPLLQESSYSFPSGHAIFLFALSAGVWMYNRKIGWWFLGASVVNGLARIVAGVHYPADILVGAILGSIIAYSINIIANKLFKQP